MRKQYMLYDKEFYKDSFLKRHQECLPFIGEKYEESRLLLIGESHYVPKDEVKIVDIRDYYDTSFDNLKNGEYKTWINTRTVFEKRVYNHEEFKQFFSNPATEIAKCVNKTDVLSKEQKIEAMHQYAFMNYFKRPSFEKAKTIRGLTEKDYEMAYEVSSNIIEILRPKLIVFISKKAYNAFCEYDNNKNLFAKYTIKSVSHPSSSWWNRKRKDGRSAREDFYSYIKEIF